MPTNKEPDIHLVAAGPKRCCSCKNDRPCDCGCVCEDMTNLDDSGNTPTTKKQENPNEDCYKAMQFNNYNYSDDPGQPTCQDPYEEPFTGPKPPCWMFVAKDCGDHVMCTEEEAKQLCDYPEMRIMCDGEVIPVLRCYECPCDCETASKAAGYAEGMFFNSKASCEEWRVDDDPGSQDCDKCVEVPFPQGENGSICDDLRSNYINCKGNSACIGQQASTTCWTIVDKTCADLGSGCVEKEEPEGVKCEPSASEADCPLLQNCYSSCPNGTFVSEEKCGEWRDANDDDGCYDCEPCASADLANCWCLRPRACEELGFYSGETECDNQRVSKGCEGGGGIECATCMKNDLCSEETEVDCYELVNTSCDSIGGSFSNKADCDESLVSDSSNRCYKCYQITDCDDCWSSNGRSEQCWGVRPMNCSEIGGMSGAACEQAIEDSDEDAVCLKCVDQECPETENCFKLEVKTCAEISGCAEFCDGGQASRECSTLDEQSESSRCPDCVECVDCPVCVSDVTIHAVVNIFVSGAGEETYGPGGQQAPQNSTRKVPFEYSYNHSLDTKVKLNTSYNYSRCSGLCGNTWNGSDEYTEEYHNYYYKSAFAPGVVCPTSNNSCIVISNCFGAVVRNGQVIWDTGWSPNNDVCLSGVVYHVSSSFPPGCKWSNTDSSNCFYNQWDQCEDNGDSDDHIMDHDCLTQCGPFGKWGIGAGVDFCADTGQLMRVSVSLASGDFTLDTDYHPGGHPLGTAYSINDFITGSSVPMYLYYNPPSGAFGPGTIGGSAQIDVIYHTYTAPNGGCP